MPLELYLNATSPYARIARACAIEKGLESRLQLHWVDPWADDAALLAVNPHAKVPALRTPEGLALNETLPIAFYLDTLDSGPALVPAENATTVLHDVGLGMGLVDAAFQTVIARKHADSEDPDRSVLGRRRLAAIERGLQQLEGDRASRQPPGAGCPLTLGDIVIAVALDYLRFRMSETGWPQRFPALVGWEASRREHPCLKATAFPMN